MPPKAFISYSWTSKEYSDRVREWAERLISSDGIDILLDQFDLKEGQDKYAYMERMVNDPSVTHVLVFCDKKYAEKADAREAGVGTETQIITPKIYASVAQSKFIPIVCEFDSEGEPYLPTFMKGRIWLDFSSLEATNQNWERLVRLLYDKPLYVKPTLGKPPSYLTDNSTAPLSPSKGKWDTLKQALLAGRSGIATYRSDFLDSCIEYADTLRIRQQPDLNAFPQRILDDCSALSHVRNHITDWLILETGISRPDELNEILITFLERMLELKARPADVTSWNDGWFEAQGLFVYESFLYIVAALLKRNAFASLNAVFSAHYLRPETEAYSNERFEEFDTFYASSSALHSVLDPPGQKLLSPTAALIQRQANRTDIPFKALMEAELLIFLVALLNPTTRWYPHTLHYAKHSTLPFFVRTTQHKGFLNLATITGISDPVQMREQLQAGLKRLNVAQWHDFRWGMPFLDLLNAERWDTLK